MIKFLPQPTVEEKYQWVYSSEEGNASPFAFGSDTLVKRFDAEFTESFE